jgi:catechol 2,3-dioxygenase-like lactoylglutathione lyase family enzyme
MDDSMSGLKTTLLSGPPRMLHHTAYVTHDVTATVDFYTRVLRMKLVSSVIDDAVPSTGDPFPYIHLFFQMADGSTVAFFESLDLPAPAEVSHPAYKIFNHLALDVGSVEAVNQWARHLAAEGVEFIGPVEHGIIHSIYFYDPNGIRLELTADVTTEWKSHGARATDDVAKWEQLKAQSKMEGSSASAVAWIKERRHIRPDG